MEISQSSVESLDNNAVQFQLHFHLWNERLHSMDAVVYNECERNFIQAIKEVQKYFDFELDIEVLAKEEGGVVGNYIIKACKHPTTHASILILITSLSNFMFSSKTPTSEGIKDKIEIIDKVKSGDYTQEEFNYIASDDPKLMKLESNFFKSALKEKKIKKIETQVDKETPVVLEYKDFSRKIFEQKDVKEKSEIMGATIHIVAPVLIQVPKSKLKWRGLYLGNPIDFKILDKYFLKQVEEHQIKFGNGTNIKCTLEVTTITKYDESGEARQEYSYLVKEVSQWEDEDKFVDVQTTYKKNKRIDNQTPLLFSEDDMEDV